MRASRAGTGPSACRPSRAAARRRRRAWSWGWTAGALAAVPRSGWPRTASPRDGPYYTKRRARAELVRRLATAAGALGSSAEYLFNTRDGLRSLGIRDRWVEGLACEVQAAQAEASAPG